MSDTQKIVVRCAGCSAKLGLPAQVAGKKIKCPKCKAPLRVPESRGQTKSASIAAVSKPKRRAANAKAKSAVRETVPASVPQDDGGLGLDLLEQLDTGSSVESAEERQERFQSRDTRRKEAAAAAKKPAKKSKQAKAKRASSFDFATWIVDFLSAFAKRDIMSNITRLAAIGAIGIGVKAYTESGITEVAFAEPSDITCYQLGMAGPGENHHVRMTDFILLDQYVFESNGGSWNGAYVPAISQEDINRQIAGHWRVPFEEVGNLTYEQRNDALVALQGSFKFRVIVSFPEAGNAGYVDNRAEEEVLQGIVLGKVPEDVRSLLSDGFTGFRMAECQVLEYGRKPKDARAIQNYWWGSGALLLVSLILAGYRASAGP